MIIQIGTEADESRILWKHKESDGWERADIDDLICAYEDSERIGEWITKKGSYEIICSECGYEAFSKDGEWFKSDYCPTCGAKMGEKE